MLSTIILVASFLGLLLLSVVFWALFLRLGLRWAKVPDVTTRRVIFATIVLIVLQVALNVLFLLASPSSELQSLFLALVVLAAALLVPCLVIREVFGARFLRAVQAWLPTQLASAPIVALVLLVFRPFLFEAFVIPTNAMAPTLVGNHRQGVCPKCGQPNYCSPIDERFGASDPPQMICDQFHVVQAPSIDNRVHSADRLLAAKFLTPRRWDLIVFRYPGNPSKMYVKRLVGLPGEKIHIEDGMVWINGERQTPPDSIRGIEYLSRFPDWDGPVSGSIDRPAQLRDDEYFVLGDFSAQSQDSRFWEKGAPGHNSFAVPKSYLNGVVTHIYWPSHRWRILR
ncbi:MAG: signal peptidase I [Planctomycetaceae bacterium]|nr:signal peptidase I [Planctomycetaceae bacterium]